MAPMAPDPSFGEGVQSGNQQSYLTQILANTKAAQQNEAQIRQQQNQMLVSPDVFKHGAGAQMANGATQAPDGTPRLIYNSPAAFAQARATDEAKYNEKADLDSNEAVANGAITAGLVTPDHPAWSSVQLASDRKPLNPRAAKDLEDLGVVTQKMGLTESGFDKWGREIVKPKLSPENVTGGAQAITPESPAGQRRLGQGFTVEQKTVTNPMTGLTTPTYDWKQGPAGTGIDDLAAMRTLKARGVLREDANLTNMTDSEWANVTAAKTKMQADASGQKVTVNMGAAAVGPLKPSQLATYVNPDTGIFASSDPKMVGANPEKLLTSGYVHASELGGAKGFHDAVAAGAAAHGHIDQYRQIIKKYDGTPDQIFPPASSGWTAAKIQSYWNQLRSKNSPAIAELDALEPAGFMLQGGMSPGTGLRQSVQLLGTIHHAMADTTKPASREAVLAALDRADNAVTIATKAKTSRASEQMPGTPGAAPVQEPLTPDSREGTVSKSGAYIWKNRQWVPNK